jgi:hypothetical protein
MGLAQDHLKNSERFITTVMSLKKQVSFSRLKAIASQLARYFSS